MVDNLLQLRVLHHHQLYSRKNNFKTNSFVINLHTSLSIVDRNNYVHLSVLYILLKPVYRLRMFYVLPMFSYPILLSPVLNSGTITQKLLERHGNAIISKQNQIPQYACIRHLEVDYYHYIVHKSAADV